MKQVRHQLKITSVVTIEDIWTSKSAENI